MTIISGIKGQKGNKGQKGFKGKRQILSVIIYKAS
jgi:hypothetical protein